MKVSSDDFDKATADYLRLAQVKFGQVDQEREVPERNMMNATCFNKD